MNNHFSPRVKYYIDNYLDGIRLASTGKGIAFIHSGMHSSDFEQYFNVELHDIVINNSDMDFSIIYSNY
ncbi:hypothetical protein [Streptococcus pantholopis]|uniref:Uncharacterized protein n=1 Tax=Streptococcus pantholopis TaxID=1811193 RepID=A0A172Q6R5_9STRE|nr:hypothetical protein [Streptococcus pantholopis]AND79107.1 hypothetical protein A0O21_03240 [Streptococcus pantholopis]